uniref:Uncharacterized protein n=1 Tax=Caenorhabditis tropicalis TaxID=1561998 RepID=A0A1I7UU90_9PELO
MTKHRGATDAFNEIALKVDEALIQADAHLRDLRRNAIDEKTASLAERTVVPSPIGSERSCSPNPSRVAASSTSSDRTSFKTKSKAFLSLDKKKGVVITTFKSMRQFTDAEMTEIQKMFVG